MPIPRAGFQRRHNHAQVRRQAGQPTDIDFAALIDLLPMQGPILASFLFVFALEMSAVQPDGESPLRFAPPSTR